MKSQFDNIAKIPCDSMLSFFRLWLVFLKPFHNMKPKEIEVASYMLYTRMKMMEKVIDKDLIDDLVFRHDSKKQIMKWCGITQVHLNTIITRLREAGFIIETRINPRYVPNYDDSGTFRLMLMFDIDKGKENTGNVKKD
jgi:hypothetical protein